MIKMLTLASTILTFFAVSFQSVAQESDQGNCALAEEYYSQSQERDGMHEVMEAALNLERAGAACPQFKYFLELGELRTISSGHLDRQLAVDAFVEAHSLASSDKERARALWKYAALLNQEQDPQNADGLIREAKRLDPGNQEIAELAVAIQDKIDNPTSEQIFRGLAASLYKPVHTVAATGQVAGAESDAAATSEPVESGERNSIRIPINFAFNSTALDALTARNVELLASTLADAEFQGRQFEFVGHADVRGDAQYNLELSRRRAHAIYETVVDIEPSMSGRIKVKGMGESNPIDLRDTEEAHRVNRRLQVIID